MPFLPGRSGCELTWVPHDIRGCLMISVPLDITGCLMISWGCLMILRWYLVISA